MPVYEYRCLDCGERFELMRPAADADAPASCPAGHGRAMRLLSVFASVGRAPGPAERPPGPCGS
ncbi:MAG: FmdB family transcriptional regulator, partial [Chloroflexota bacterium]